MYIFTFISLFPHYLSSALLSCRLFCSSRPLHSPIFTLCCGSVALLTHLKLFPIFQGFRQWTVCKDVQRVILLYLVPFTLPPFLLFTSIFLAAFPFFHHFIHFYVLFLFFSSVNVDKATNGGIKNRKHLYFLWSVIVRGRLYVFRVKKKLKEC